MRVVLVASSSSFSVWRKKRVASARLTPSVPPFLVPPTLSPSVSARGAAEPVAFSFTRSVLARAHSLRASLSPAFLPPPLLCNLDKPKDVIVIAIAILPRAKMFLGNFCVKYEFEVPKSKHHGKIYTGTSYIA